MYKGSGALFHEAHHVAPCFYSSQILTLREGLLCLLLPPPGKVTLAVFCWLPPVTTSLDTTKSCTIHLKIQHHSHGTMDLMPSPDFGLRESHWALYIWTKSRCLLIIWSREPCTERWHSFSLLFSSCMDSRLYTSFPIGRLAGAGELQLTYGLV